MCRCGHDTDDHAGGRCAAECVDTGHYGIYKCLCPAYIKETQ